MIGQKFCVPLPAHPTQVGKAACGTPRTCLGRTADSLVCGFADSQSAGQPSAGRGFDLIPTSHCQRTRRRLATQGHLDLGCRPAEAQMPEDVSDEYDRRCVRVAPRRLAVGETGDLAVCESMTSPGLRVRQSSGALERRATRGRAAHPPKRLSCGRKAVEDYRRCPRRFARHGAGGKSARSWSAPVLWRFGAARYSRAGGSFLQTFLLRSKSGRGLPQSKTLREALGWGQIRQVLECARARLGPVPA